MKNKARTPNEKSRCAVFTVKTAAERMSVCESVVYDLVASGVLPHYRIGKTGSRGAIRIEAADLDAFLASLRREKEPEAVKPPARNSKVILKHLKLKPA